MTTVNYANIGALVYLVAKECSHVRVSTEMNILKNRVWRIQATAIKNNKSEQVGHTFSDAEIQSISDPAVIADALLDALYYQAGWSRPK